MKVPLKVGDRVRVYGNSQTGSIEDICDSVSSWVATIESIGPTWLRVKADPRHSVSAQTNHLSVHPRQCRRLKPKRERRRVWIRERDLNRMKKHGAWSTCISEGRSCPDDVEFQEVRKK